MKSNRILLINQALDLAFSVTNFFEKGKNKDETIAYLTKLLSQTEYETNTIVHAINIHLEQSRNAPTLCDIITILRSKKEKELELELEDKWLYFQCNAFGSGKKIEPWAREIKKRLGTDRIDKSHISDVVWIKKEFFELMPKLMNGDIGYSTQQIDSKAQEMIIGVVENSVIDTDASKDAVKRYMNNLTEEERLSLKQRAYDQIQEELNLGSVKNFESGFTNAMASHYVHEIIRQEMERKKILKVGNE